MRGHFRWKKLIKDFNKICILMIKSFFTTIFSIIVKVRWGPFKNHVDNRGWVGGLKFAIFVHVQYIKNVHEGKWVVQNEQNYVHVVFE